MDESILPPRKAQCALFDCTKPAEIKSTKTGLWFCVADAPTPRDNASGKADR